MGKPQEVNLFQQKEKLFRSPFSYFVVFGFRFFFFFQKFIIYGGAVTREVTIEPQGKRRLSFRFW